MTSLTYASPAAFSTAAVLADKPPVARTLAAGIFMAVAGFGGFDMARVDLRDDLGQTYEIEMHGQLPQSALHRGDLLSPDQVGFNTELAWREATAVEIAFPVPS